MSTTASRVQPERGGQRDPPCCSRSSAGPISGAMTANGAMVISRYSATLPLLSGRGGREEQRVGQRDRHGPRRRRSWPPPARSARSGRTYVGTVGGGRAVDQAVHLEPISRLRYAAARVTVMGCSSPWGRRSSSCPAGSGRLRRASSSGADSGSSWTRRWGNWSCPDVRGKRPMPRSVGQMAVHAAVPTRHRFFPIRGPAEVSATGGLDRVMFGQYVRRWTPQPQSPIPGPARRPRI